MDKGQIDALEESNMNLSISNKELRERIENLERTNEQQREALKVSHDVADGLEKERDALKKELQMLQT